MCYEIKRFISGDIQLDILFDKTIGVLGYQSKICVHYIKRAETL